jgi:hypothetical protein
MSVAPIHFDAKTANVSNVAVCGKQGGAERELIPSRAVDNRDSAASIWMLTLGLFVWFLIGSLVAALLATHFGWLAPAKALV